MRDNVRRKNDERKTASFKKALGDFNGDSFLVLMVGFAHTSFDLCQKSEAFYLENSLQGNFIGTDMASFQMRGEGNLIDRSFMLSGSKLLGEVDMAKLSHLEIKARLGLAKVYFLPKGEKKAIRLAEGSLKYQDKGKLILIGRFFTGRIYFDDKTSA